MRMSLSVDELEWLIYTVKELEFESEDKCAVGLKLISHLPLELQKEYKSIKEVFKTELEFLISYKINDGEKDTQDYQDRLV